MSIFVEKPVYIVEGFDILGKTTFIDTVMKSYSKYTASHDVTDSTIGRNNSWAIGYSILDFLSQVPVSSKVIIDRGIFSSIVYACLYEPYIPISEEVIKWYLNSEFFNSKVGHIYLTHRDKNTARRIYEIAQKRVRSTNAITDKYDSFSDFEHYWETYLKFDKAYRDAYQMLGVTPYTVKTAPGEFVVYQGEFCRGHITI